MPTRAWLVGLFLLALAVRCGAWLQARADPGFDALVGDAARYHDWAGRIVAGDWLSRSEGVFYQAPLYPYVLALHRAAFGDGAIHAVRATQVLLGSAAAVLLAVAAARLVGGGRAGAVAAATAGVVWALQPAAVFFDLQVDKASLDGFLLCLILLVVAAAVDRPRWWHAPLAGGLVGLLSLSRENAMVLMAVVVPLAWHAGRRLERWPARVEHWLLPLLAIAAFAATLASVTIRNHVVGGEWHLTTCQFGPNFYIGNGREADGLYRPLIPGRGDPKFERTDAVALAERAAGRLLSPREVSRYWTIRALREMSDSPGHSAALLGRKWLMAFHAAEVADNNDIDTLTVASPILRALDATLHAGVLVSLAAAGVVLAWPDRRRWGWVAAMLLLMSLAVALFYNFGRYRFPLLPMLTLLAAVGAAAWPEARHRRAHLAVAAAVGIVAAVVCNAAWVLPERVRGADRYHRGLAWQARGELVHAEAEYRRAIARNPSLEPAHTNLGLLLAGRGAYDDAVDHLATAARLRPDDPAVLNNLGMALGGRGDLDAAIAEFEPALAADPTYEPAQRNLSAARTMRRQDP